MYIGGLHMTRGIQKLVDAGELDYKDLWDLVSRHINLDYGTVGSDSVRINNSNLNHNCGNVMSQYELEGRRIWIITEIGDIDTTYTTILLPSEY